MRVYVFSAPTTRLRVWGTYKALTKQGEVHQYIDYVVCFNTRDSYYHPKEHTILYVFRAPGSDSLVPLNWYEQYYFLLSATALPPFPPTSCTILRQDLSIVSG